MKTEAGNITTKLVLVVGVMGLLAACQDKAELSESESAAVAERIEKIGSVTTFAPATGDTAEVKDTETAAAETKQDAPDTAPAAAAGANGEKTYRAACFTCHDTGIVESPKLGDKAAWEPRIAQGMDVLYEVSLNGKPGTPMLPKGGRPDLSDDDVKAAVDFMVEKAQ